VGDALGVTHHDANGSVFPGIDLPSVPDLAQAVVGAGEHEVVVSFFGVGDGVDVVGVGGNLKDDLSAVEVVEMDLSVVASSQDFVGIRAEFHGKQTPMSSLVVDFHVFVDLMFSDDVAEIDAVAPSRIDEPLSIGAVVCVDDGPSDVHGSDALGFSPRIDVVEADGSVLVGAHVCAAISGKLATEDAAAKLLEELSRARKISLGDVDFGTWAESSHGSLSQTQHVDDVAILDVERTA